MPRYNPAAIEPKWQRIWEERRTFQTPVLPTGPKLYVLDMFPYPSGSGLHVGHPEGYTATDIVCRFERMRGKSVLHPMGFDSFGLPAEEHAIKTNTPPRSNTEQNIATFTRQLKLLGFSYDWNRVLATTDLEYFRWTQWIFLVLFDTWFDPAQQKGRPISELPIPAEVRQSYGGFTGEDAVRRYQDDHRLAYQSDALVNWCPGLGTVVANEEVIDGKSERGGHPVQRLPLRQWMLRITAYADRLERDLEGLDWSEGIKKLQKDWIGRSTGAEVDFFIGAKSGFDAWKAARAKSGYPGKPADDVLRIYTTRPDTLFGATYMVIAPEHPFVARLTTPEQKAAVEAYVARAAGRSDRERQEEKKEKTGVFTGSYAINPVNGAAVPIWIADYVLISYGTGAIMAVPAHDERDMAFAKQFGIPVIAVVDPPEGTVRVEEEESPTSFSRKTATVNRNAVLAGEECFAGAGTAINSGKYNGLSTANFKSQISNDLNSAGLGRVATNYKLRDWLFSRQRFWGEPFPILHELGPDGKPNGLLRAVKPEELPVDLPHLDDYKPIGRPEPPLGKAPAEWLYPTIDGKKYRRETNTMPQWAGSCWYFLRFIDPRNAQRFVGAEQEKAWMPVDLYVGGAEHAVLHLLYSRFWHKVLYDRGHVTHPEPFQKLVNQGMILGEMEYRVSAEGHAAHRTEIERRGLKIVTIKDDEGEEIHILKQPAPGGLANLSDEQIEKRKGKIFLKGSEIELTGRSDKMSKSRGNVVNPDDVVRDYGADSLRLYEMFMGPLEATKPWSMQGVSGVRNFLDRVWRLLVDTSDDDPPQVGAWETSRLKLHPAVQDMPPTDEQNRMLHRTIKAVTHDIEKLLVNTAIARMMEFVNFFTKETVRPRRVLEQFVLLLSPYAPHIAEELWELLGHKESLAYEPWPTYDESLTIDASVEIPVQIKGKLRAKITVPAGLDAAALEAAARADAKVAEQLAGQTVVKIIAVPGKLVNFVTK